MEQRLMATDIPVESLRQDVLRWNVELMRLKAEGQNTAALERWIRDAERTLSLWA
jgi:hypothetical protein